MNINAVVIEHGETNTIQVTSALVDMVYALIEQTYCGVDRIIYQNPTDAPNQALSDFLTYILAYPKDVKTPQVILSSGSKPVNIQQDSRFAGRTFICFSGGVDSTGALLGAIEAGKSPVALWCDYGQPYRIPEQKTVTQICGKLDVPLIQAVLDLSDLIALGGTRFGHVFPARNLMIATICLCFQPSEILLAGLCDELVVPDKSPRMYNEFGKYFGVPLYSPFAHITKAEVLCLWKSRWNQYLSAEETISCYSSNGNCQNCSSCAKREVAMVASGYTDTFPEVFTNQHELIEEHWFSRIDSFQYERRTDMLIALDKFRDRLTSKLQRLLDVKCIQYQGEINRRKVQLQMTK